MKIETRKDLAALIKLCRKEGVQSIRVDNIEMHLGEAPRTASKRPSAAQAKQNIMASVFDPAPGEVEQGKVETDELTPEQLLDWSIQGPVGMTDPN